MYHMETSTFPVMIRALSQAIKCTQLSPLPLDNSVCLVQGGTYVETLNNNSSFSVDRKTCGKMVFTRLRTWGRRDQGIFWRIWVVLMTGDVCIPPNTSGTPRPLKKPSNQPDTTPKQPIPNGTIFVTTQCIFFSRALWVKHFGKSIDLRNFGYDVGVRPPACPPIQTVCVEAVWPCS